MKLLCSFNSAALIRNSLKKTFKEEKRHLIGVAFQNKNAEKMVVKVTVKVVLEGTSWDHERKSSGCWTIPVEPLKNQLESRRF